MSQQNIPNFNNRRITARNVASHTNKRKARITSISGGKMVFPPNFFGKIEEKKQKALAQKFVQSFLGT
mgnify:CR=1 FL=1